MRPRVQRLKAHPDYDPYAQLDEAAEKIALIVKGEPHRLKPHYFREPYSAPKGALFQSETLFRLSP
jgi:hypothetical protein